MNKDKNIVTPSYDPKYKDIINKIEHLLEEKDKVLVAIDGMSGSGKTTLSELLEDIYHCNVFHMDDYFLDRKSVV